MSTCTCTSISISWGATCDGLASNPGEYKYSQSFYAKESGYKHWPGAPIWLRPDFFIAKDENMETTEIQKIIQHYPLSKWKSKHSAKFYWTGEFGLGR